MARATGAIGKPSTMARLALAVTRGVAAGWMAGIPQVLLAQVAGLLVGERERADIGPRFIRQAARYEGRPLSGPLAWLIAAIFHFEYAAWWGALYSLAAEALGRERVPPLLGGGVLGTVIYLAAFSPWGAGTRTGAEAPVERRSRRETLLHLTAAFSFALATAATYRWLRERW